MILTTWYLPNVVEKVVTGMIIYPVIWVPTLFTCACVGDSLYIPLPSQRMNTNIIMSKETRKKIEISKNLA